MYVDAKFSEALRPSAEDAQIPSTGRDCARARFVSVSAFAFHPADRLGVKHQLSGPVWSHAGVNTVLTRPSCISDPATGAWNANRK